MEDPNSDPIQELVSRRLRFQALIFAAGGVILPFAAAGLLATLGLPKIFSDLSHRRLSFTSEFCVTTLIGILLNWYSIWTIRRSWRVPDDRDICGLQNRVWRTVMTIGYLLGCAMGFAF